jgi:LysM repeat protein
LLLSNFVKQKNPTVKEMKQVLFFAIVLLSSKFSYTQSNLLYVEGSSNNEYLLHKVVAKENWYSIGRLYNVHPKELAGYNKNQANKGLMVSQEVKVPIVESNRYNIDTLLSAEYALIPIFYKVKKGDGLYAVATAHNTTMQSIRQLNDLATDILQEGQTIQVGNIKVISSDSRLAQTKFDVPSKRQVYPTADENTNTTTAQATTTNSSKVIVSDEPKTTQKQVMIEQVTDAELNPSVAVKPKVETVINPTDKSTNSISDSKSNTEKTTPSVPTQLKLSNKQLEEGYFKKGYTPASSMEKVMNCGIFNIVAGEKEHRYYALMDGVVPGTIVQVKSKETGKVVFVKVLGKVPSTYESNTMALCRSAANTMGGDLDKLIVSVKY